MEGIRVSKLSGILGEKSAEVTPYTRVYVKRNFYQVEFKTK